MSLPRIAVDAMGGDEGVRVMVEGAALARRQILGPRLLAAVADLCVVITQHT